ncbi:hypothetical protein DWUX_2048 [Desulfovibrio diazotrophicus]|nr:hypothetical protein DWUX_2048 [Desulfovibrio diazotrophicus]
MYTAFCNSISLFPLRFCSAKGSSCVPCRAEPCIIVRYITKMPCRLPSIQADRPLSCAIADVRR